MTKSDYFLIAKAIKETFKDDPRDNDQFAAITQTNKKRLIFNLIREMKKDNPNFQSFRFLLACDAAELQGLV